VKTVDWSVYLVTDRDLMTSATIEECVEQAIRGGAGAVQLREKTASSREFHETALRVREVTSRYGVPLIINDRVDIALAADADGVHVGQCDLPAPIVRRLIGPEKILGVSAATREEALAAAKDADYLGVGAMFPTGTKTDARATTMETLRGIVRDVDIPVVVIGGINSRTAPLFKGTGIAGFAVVSAVVSQQDVAGAARELKELFRQL